MAGERILVVDDDDRIREFIANTVLTLEGYTIFTAKNGLTGYEAVKEHNPDLVVTDYDMPVMTGIAMVEKMRDSGLNQPVILMTAEGSEKIAAESLRLGVMDYFIKPFDTDELIQAVSRVLGASSAGTVRLSVPDQQHLQTVNALTGIGKAIISSLDLGTIFSHVVEAAVDLTDADECLLMLVDKDTEDLYIRASKNVEQGFQNLRLKVNNSLAGQAISTGQPVMISGEEQKKIVTAYLVKSLLYVPLKAADDRVLGILGLHNRSEEKKLDELTLGTISALADYAAIGIINAQLYEQSRVELTKLERIFHHLPNPFIVFDNNQQVIVSNEAARNLFGPVEGTVTGMPITEVINNNKTLNELVELSWNSLPVTREVEFSESRVFQAYIGEVAGIGCALLMQDISNLVELNRIKTEFVTNVSHDLRSPLTAILSYVELMGRVGELNDNQKKFATEVRKSVTTITDLITDLLDLTRVESGLDRKREAFKLAEVAAQSVEALRGKAEVKSQKLVYKAANGNTTILGNPVRMKQVFTNLIDNAIKYTPENGDVNVTLSTESNQIIATVKDSGIGIPPEAQAHVFEKFYRVDAIASSYEGTGLGLNIVSVIIEDHDGRVWVESTPGEGSTFTIMLPTYTADK